MEIIEPRAVRAGWRPIYREVLVGSPARTR
jgi:hypothetical protein